MTAPIPDDIDPDVLGEAARRYYSWRDNGYCISWRRLPEGDRQKWREADQSVKEWMLANAADLIARVLRERAEAKKGE
jgi:hypothetical protein